MRKDSDSPVSTIPAFAEKLYRSLEDAGMRVLWDRFDVLPGEPLRDQIIAAIHQHGLIVVLSANGMASGWVRQEIELTWYHKRDSLVPIRLCEIDKVQAWTPKHEKLPGLAGLFHVLDFSAWHNESEDAHAVSLRRSRNDDRTAESHDRPLHWITHVFSPSRPPHW